MNATMTACSLCMKANNDRLHFSPADHCKSSPGSHDDPPRKLSGTEKIKELEDRLQPGVTLRIKQLWRRDLKSSRANLFLPRSIPNILFALFLYNLVINFTFTSRFRPLYSYRLASSFADDEGARLTLSWRSVVGSSPCAQTNAGSQQAQNPDVSNSHSRITCSSAKSGTFE